MPLSLIQLPIPTAVIITVDKLTVIRNFDNAFCTAILPTTPIQINSVGQSEDFPVQFKNFHVG